MSIDCGGCDFIDLKVIREGTIPRAVNLIEQLYRIDKCEQCFLPLTGFFLYHSLIKLQSLNNQGDYFSASVSDSYLTSLFAVHVVDVV